MNAIANLNPRRTDIDWRLKAYCEDAARRGMAVDVAWCPELQGQGGRDLARARRRNAWRGKFARPKFVSG